jgi:hypothetical protein
MNIEIPVWFALMCVFFLGIWVGYALRKSVADHDQPPGYRFKHSKPMWNRDGSSNWNDDPPYPKPPAPTARPPHA